MLEGNNFPLNKCSHRETSDVAERLHNFGFLNKDRNEYTVTHADRKYLKKLIELNSWNKFKDWLNQEEEKSPDTTVTNNFYESSVGQINQAIGGGSIKKPKNSNKSTKDSLLKRASLWIGIIVGVFSVGFILYKIFYK